MRKISSTLDNTNQLPTHYTTTHQLERDHVSARLEQKMYFEDTLVVFPHGVVVSLFKSYTFLAFRQNRENIFPLLIRKSELQENKNLVTDRVYKYLKESSLKIDRKFFENFFSAFMWGVIKRFSSVSKEEEQIALKKTFKLAVCEVFGMAESSSGMSEVNAYIDNLPLDTFYIPKKYNSVLNRLAGTAYMFFKEYALSEDDTHAVMQKITKIAEGLTVSLDLKEMIHDQIMNYYPNPYLKRSLDYLTKLEHFIILLPPTVSSHDIIYALYDGNSKLRQSTSGFAMPSANLISVMLLGSGVSDLPRELEAMIRNHHLQHLDSGVLPLIYGGLTILAEDGSLPVGFWLNTFSEEVTDYLTIISHASFLEDELENFPIYKTKIQERLNEIALLTEKIINEPHEVLDDTWKIVEELVDHSQSTIVPHNKLIIREFAIDDYPEKDSIVTFETSRFYGNNVNFKVEKNIKAKNRVYSWLVSSDIADKSDKFNKAYFLRDLVQRISTELQLLSLYHEESYFKEIIGRFHHLFLRHSGLMEYIFKDLPIFTQIYGKIIDILETSPKHTHTPQNSNMPSAAGSNRLEIALSNRINYYSEGIQPRISSSNSYQKIPEQLNEPIKYTKINMSSHSAHVILDTGEELVVKSSATIPGIQIFSGAHLAIEGLHSEQVLDFSNMNISYEDLRIEQVSANVTRIIQTQGVKHEISMNNTVIGSDQLQQETVIIIEGEEIQPCQLVGNAEFNQSNTACNNSWQAWMIWTAGLAHNPMIFIPVAMAVAIYGDNMREHAHDLVSWIKEKTGIDLALPENSVIRLALEMTARAMLGGPITMTHDLAATFVAEMRNYLALSSPRSATNYLHAGFWAVTMTSKRITRSTYASKLLGLWDWAINSPSSTEQWWHSISGAMLWDIVAGLSKKEPRLLERFDNALEELAKTIPGYQCLENPDASKNISTVDYQQLINNDNHQDNVNLFSYG